ENSCVSNIKEKVMIFIFYFAHISTYRKLREIFEVAHANLFRIIREMSRILVKIAMKEIRFPQPEDYTILKEGFLKYSNNRGPILAIDGTHINISKPNIGNPFDYYDRKGNFSVNFVCLVDYKQRFRAVSYGF
ncbi:putative nuclease HARBI1, partial [Cucumispora dikerogammari]